MIELGILDIIVFLPGIIYLGLVTSYSDIKYSKIRNRDITHGLIYAVIAYTFLISMYYLNGIAIRKEYLLELSASLIIALFFGFTLWHFKLWSAADAKLFLAFSFLVPLSIYELGYVSYFPSFVILLNTFIPFIFYVIPKAFFSTSLKEKKKQLCTLKLSTFLNMVLVFFIITWVLSSLSKYFKINLNIFFSLTVIYILIFASKLVFKKFLNPFLITIALLRVILDAKNVLTIPFAIQLMSFSFVLLLVLAISSLTSNLFIQKLPIKFLKEGAVISDIIYFDKQSKKYKKVDPSNAEILKKIAAEKTILELNSYSEGLTGSDIVKIKKLSKTGRLDFLDVNIHQTLPFAPFLFFGVILTILSHGNLAIYLRNIIVNFIN